MAPFIPMARAGYSGTPLPQKLGIKEGHAVATVYAPPQFDLGVLPAGATLQSGLGRGKARLDVVVVFVKQRAVMVDEIPRCRARLQQDGGLWIAWPKKSSGVATDIVEDTIRAVALPTGLVDNKVCAIDDTWSGLRLVIRKSLREQKPVAPAAKPATAKRSAPARTRRRALPR